MSALTDAREAVGGLSKPSKMPGWSYSIPAKECNVGSKLRVIPNSVCSICYALKGRYVFNNVQAAQYRRLATLTDPAWCANMATAINGQPWFRWFDSGDLQSLAHLRKIVEVCKATPTTRHWLPTREKKVVQQFLRSAAFPDNLTVRLSAVMIDGQLPKVQINTSSVSKDAPPKGYSCPAPQQQNQCGDCRACWDKSIQNVSYDIH